MNLTKHTLHTHIRSEVRELHIRLKLIVVRLLTGSPGLVGFFSPKKTLRFPVGSFAGYSVSFRNSVRFFFDFFRLQLDFFLGAFRRTSPLQSCRRRRRRRRRRGLQFGGDHPLSCAKANLMTHFT